MNCENVKDLLAAYIENLLELSQQQEVSEHLNECSDCKAEFDELEDVHRRLSADGDDFKQPDIEEKVLCLIVKQQSHEIKQLTKQTRQFKMWRNIMKNRMTKYVAAAVIVIVGSVAFMVFGKMAQPSVAWAQIPEYIENCVGVRYSISEGMRIEIDPESPLIEREGIGFDDMGMHGVKKYYDEKGFLSVSFFTDRQEKVITQIVYPEKYAHLQYCHGNEESFISRIKDTFPVLLSDEGCRYLGQKETVDGITVVEGVEKIITTDFVEMAKRYAAEGRQFFVAERPDGSKVKTSKYIIHCWVDVSTGLPYRIQHWSYLDDVLHFENVMEDFEWDVQIASDVFEPQIPDDFEIIDVIKETGGPDCSEEEK